MTSPDLLEHPEPTGSTVKEMYAHAFTCAKPDCFERLYRQPVESGRRVLNSRVAHIHARRRNGPRWLEGMSSEANRSAENLLLLCIQHAYEVDEHADRFSPELLCEWRQAQLDDFETGRPPWILDDEEVHEVQRDSFGAPATAAPVLAEAVRAVERFLRRAETSRPSIAARAGAWAAEWHQARARVVGWDHDGNSVHGELPSAIARQHQEALIEALRSVWMDLDPLLEDVGTEIAAIQHMLPRAVPWCDWLVIAVNGVYASAGRWPGPPPAGDDDELTLATAEARRALAGLAAVLRGDTPEAPPPAPNPGGIEVDESAADQTAGEDVLAAFRSLLDRARPWARVEHRPYDAALRDELVGAAADAATLPPVINAIELDLEAVSALAAAVARNAIAAELSAMIDSDRAKRPLVIAVALLVGMWNIHRDAEDTAVADRAKDALLAELAATDWTDIRAWSGNDVRGARMFSTWATFDSPDAPRSALSAALDQVPERLDEVITCCAPWVQRENRVTGRVTFSRSYRSLPEWFPSQAVVKAAALRYPDLAATTSTYDDGPAEGISELEHLIGHVLRLAAT